VSAPAPAPAPSGEPLRGAAPWLAQQLYVLAMVLWANGVFLRLTLRDGEDFLAPIYYATPWPVLAVLTLPFIWTFRRQPKAVFAVIVVAHLFGIAWILESLRPATGIEPEPGQVRVAQWNVGRPSDGPVRFAEKLRASEPDIIAVNEPFPKERGGAAREDVEQAWRSAFPGYEARSAGSHLLLLVRGEIERHAVVVLDRRSWAHEADVTIRGHRLAVLHVDVVGKVSESRRGAIRKITELAQQARDRPLLLLGDFNVPVDSVHLDELRKSHRNAFQSAGQGSMDTWPSFLPVLSIDQVWLGSGVRAVKTRHGLTLRSDHRPVTVELRFDDGSSPAPGETESR
jgi:endonuclease/exonuclease/phosphatase family metal-dependent hydrolase